MPVKMINWGGLFRTFEKMVRDLQANKRRPAGKPITSAAALAELEQLKTLIPKLEAFFQANPGVLTATDDLLDFLEADGATWAGPVESGVDAVPGAVSSAAEWLPDIIFALQEIQPAAIGIPGGFSGARGHV